MLNFLTLIPTGPHTSKERLGRVFIIIKEFPLIELSILQYPTSPFKRTQNLKLISLLHSTFMLNFLTLIPTGPHTSKEWFGRVSIIEVFFFNDIRQSFSRLVITKRLVTGDCSLGRAVRLRKSNMQCSVLTFHSLK